MIFLNIFSRVINLLSIKLGCIPSFWLILNYDLLEDRCIDDVITIPFCVLFMYLFIYLLYESNRFNVAVRLLSNRSHKMSKCGKNISDTFAERLVGHFFCFGISETISDLKLTLDALARD